MDGILESNKLSYRLTHELGLLQHRRGIES